MNNQILIEDLNDLKQNIIDIINKIEYIKKDILDFDAVVIGRLYKITCWNNPYIVKVTSIDKVEYSKYVSANGIHGFYHLINDKKFGGIVGHFSFKDISNIEEYNEI
jgi:hypothetical protein